MSLSSFILVSIYFYSLSVKLLLFFILGEILLNYYDTLNPIIIPPSHMKTAGNRLDIWDNKPVSPRLSLVVQINMIISVFICFSFTSVVQTAYLNVYRTCSCRRTLILWRYWMSLNHRTFTDRSDWWCVTLLTEDGFCEFSKNEKQKW